MLLERLLQDDADVEASIRNPSITAGSSDLSIDSEHTSGQMAQTATSLQHLSVEALEDICSARQIAWQHLPQQHADADADPDLAVPMKSTLISLITTDMQQFENSHRAQPLSPAAAAATVAASQLGPSSAWSTPAVPTPAEPSPPPTSAPGEYLAYSPFQQTIPPPSSYLSQDLIRGASVFCTPLLYSTP